MNKIKDSKAFEEYAYERCEEIISQNKESRELDNEILRDILEFKKALSNDLINQFNKIEGKMVLSMAINQCLVYKISKEENMYNGYKIS